MQDNKTFSCRTHRKASSQAVNSNRNRAAHQYALQHCQTESISGISSVMAVLALTGVGVCTIIIYQFTAFAALVSLWCSKSFYLYGKAG